MLEHTNDRSRHGIGWHTREYEFAELLELSNGPPHPKNADHHVADRFAGRSNFKADWCGATLDEARTRRSWPEGVAKLVTINLDGTELPRAQTRRRVRTWGDDGDEFSRDRFDAGYLDCWQTRKRRPTETVGAGFIRLTVELSADCSKGADSLIWSGVAAAKLADELETAGYRVEIAAVATCRGLPASDKEHRTVDVIHIKRAEDPLNIDAVLFAIAHPVTYRYHVFAAKLRRPFRCRGNMGWASDTPTDLRGDIHIAKVFNQHDAERIVRAELEKRSAE